MIAGGNEAAREFFRAKGCPDDATVDAKANSRAAKLYRTHLDKQAALVDVDKELGAKSVVVTSPDETDGLDAMLREAELIGKSKEGIRPAVIVNPTAFVSTGASVSSAVSSSGPMDKPRVVVRKAAPIGKISLSTAPKLSLKVPAKTNAPVAKPVESKPGATSTSTSDDFDFDAPPIVEPEAKADVPVASSLLSGAKAPAVSTPPAPPKDAFKSAKSISSDQYFGPSESDDKYVREMRAEKFGSSRAISSDDYFGRSPQAEPVDDDISFSALSSTVASTGAQLKSLASSYFKDLSTRYG